VYFACKILPIGSSELTGREHKANKVNIEHNIMEGYDVQFSFDAEGPFVVGVDPCAVVSKDFLHTDIRVVDGVLAHGLGSDASMLHREHVGVHDQFAAFLLQRRIGGDPVGNNCYTIQQARQKYAYKR
jgi:hypothetical protein